MALLKDEAVCHVDEILDPAEEVVFRRVKGEVRDMRKGSHRDGGGVAASVLDK